MAELGPILKTLMVERRLTSSELARQTGIGQPVVHRMMSGKSNNPKVKTLRPIAEYFGISISQLVGDEPISTERAIYNEVPELTWEQAVDWPSNKDSIECNKIVATDRAVGENAYALRIKDSTMQPCYPEGTLIIIDAEREPEDRDCVIMHMSDQSQVVFKQLLVDGDDRYLKPLNSDFKTTHLTDNDAYKLKGTMVQARINSRA